MTEAFLNVIQMSLSAGWLVLTVVLLRIFLRKSPHWVHVLLWGIVAIRLISPFSIESDLSLVPDWKIDGQDIVSLSQTGGTGQILDSDGNILIEEDLVSGQKGQLLDSEGNVILQKPLEPGLHSSDPNRADPIRIMAGIWCIGCVLMLGYAMVSYLRLRRRLCTSIRMQDGVRQCEYIDSPFVLGLFRPVIYLPYGMAEGDMHHVIAHEQAHIRRRDHWWKPLGFFLLTIHWFNPLMWLAYLLLCRDIELACDEKVIQELGSEQRADYTQALVHCSVNRRRIAACPLAFGEVGVKERVKSIMNYRKPSFWIMVTAVAVCIAVAVCFLTDPKPSPKFAMNGGNVRDLEPERIVERIMDFQGVESGNLYMNSDNFSLTVDADFDWNFDQTISYFYYEKRQVRSAQLRIFPEEDEYFLTESREWPDQNRIFLLRHYLDALKYLPQEAIRALAPADQYLIEHIDSGSPSDFDRVITYSAEGVGETDGWFLHLRILPQHSTGEAYSGTGEEVVHLFYGDKATEGAVKWFDYSKTPQLMDWDAVRTYTAGEFPGVVFDCTATRISDGKQVLIQGMPIWSAYLSDLNGDGYREICAETSYGSGLIDNRVIIYDYANSSSYLLEARGYFDYYLYRDGRDGQLYLEKRIYNSDVTMSSELLRIEDGAVQLPTKQKTYLKAKLLAIEDEHFLVEPIAGSPELNIASRIMVPMWNILPAMEPEIGDILEIAYDGVIQETYPAKISFPYHIRVLADDPGMDTIVIRHETESGDTSSVTITDESTIASIRSIYDTLETENYGRPLSGERLVISFLEGQVCQEEWTVSYYEEENELVTCADGFGIGNRRVTSALSYDWLLEVFENAHIQMIPTNTDLLGCPAGALLIPIDGNVYRYALTEASPEGVTVDELLYTFTEETPVEGILWEVYSLKEYPDKTAVWMISGTNSAWLCTYSPPARCSEYALDQAMAAGFVVMEDGIATSGQDIWKAFYERTQQGKPASVTVVHYYTLDPETCDRAYYETYRQDYPCLYEIRLDYDGETFTLTEPDGNDVRIRNFSYLMKYDNTAFYAPSSQTPGNRFDYVLTHDNTLTWEELFHGLVSSQMGAYIEHYSIYSEMEP